MTPTAHRPIRRWIAAAGALILALGLALVPASSAGASGVISGNVVVAGTSTPVTNEALFLYAEGAPDDFSFVAGLSSDATTGAFTFGSRADGTYRLVWSSAGGYVADHLEFNVAAGDVTLTDVELQPASEISGQITNLGTFSGAGTYVWAEDINASYSTASSISAVAADGSFTVGGISAGGEYALYFDVAETVPFFDSYYGTGLDQPTGPTGVVTIASVGDDVTGINAELVAAGIITGVISSAGTPISNASVEAYDDASGESYYSEDATDGDGIYYIKAPAGTDYEVYAWASGYFGVTYDGHLGCSCDYDPVTVSLGSTTNGIDFDLPFGEDWLDIEVIALVDDGGAFFDGNVKLYRSKPGGYGHVATEAVDDDSVIYLSQTAGSYRLRFTDGVTWYSVDDEYYFNDYIDDGYRTPANPCYIDISSMSPGDSAFVITSLVPNPSCGPEPLVVTTTGGGGGGYPSGVTATATPTPTPTPTETPTSEPDDTDDGATPAPTLDPETTAAADFGWVWWVLIALVVGGIGILAFSLFRRR